MNILVKRSLTFVDYGAQLSGAGSIVTASNSPTPQTVPDWVRQTSTWEQALRSGLAFEIGGIVPDTFRAADAKTPEVTVQSQVTSMVKEPEPEPEPVKASRRK